LDVEPGGNRHLLICLFCFSFFLFFSSNCFVTKGEPSVMGMMGMAAVFLSSGL
jgi:hypothetical protein